MQLVPGCGVDESLLEHDDDQDDLAMLCGLAGRSPLALVTDPAL